MIHKKSGSRKETFETIYKEGYWGKDVKSGAGSTLSATVVTREIIFKIITDYEIKNVLDVACGDFTWMPLGFGSVRGVCQIYRL